MSAEQVVRDFCAAWANRDVDEILGYFAEDAIYHNIPLAPAVGKEAIRGLLEFFVPPSSEISFEILHLASSSGKTGDVVHTERVDRFLMGGNNVVLPVAGVFEIRDGKIAAWRDYFDMAAWTSQTTG